MSHVQRGIVDPRREDRMLEPLGSADTRRKEGMLIRWSRIGPRAACPAISAGLSLHASKNLQIGDESPKT